MAKNKKKKDKSEKAGTQGIAFPSATVLLEIAKDEYTKERERTQFLDNKASFFMSAIILVATIFIPVIPFNKFRSVFRDGDTMQKMCLCVLCVLLVVAFLLLVTAFRNLYLSYKIKGYERFNVENLSKIDVHGQKRDLVEKALCEDYRNTIEANIKNNDDKVVYIQSGIKEFQPGFYGFV